MKLLNTEYILNNIERLMGFTVPEINDGLDEFLVEMNNTILLVPGHTVEKEAWRQYRNRRELLISIPEKSIGVEVGVAEGNHALQMWHDCRPEHMYLVDTWNNILNDEPYGLQEHLDIHYNTIQHRFTYVEDVTIIEKKSKDASLDFEDNSLDWVYLDASHGYEAVLGDLECWVPKVKSGGLIMGHDYVLPDINNYPGVKPALEDYFQETVGIELYPLSVQFEPEPEFTQWDRPRKLAQRESPWVMYDYKIEKE